MADIGVHWCDLAEHVTALRIEAVMADLQTVVQTRQWRRDLPASGPRPPGAGPDDDAFAMSVGAEDCLSVLLRFSGGARGALTVSQVSAGHKNWLTLSIDGAGGGLDWNQEQPNSLSVRRNAPAWALMSKDPTLMAPRAAAMAHAPAGHPEGYLDAFRNLIATIYDGIAHARRGEEAGQAFPSLEDGWRGVATAEAVLESARTQRWVTVAAHPDVPPQ
jgi:predicted dehydrogenase